MAFPDFEMRSNMGEVMERFGVVADQIRPAMEKVGNETKDILEKRFALTYARWEGGGNPVQVKVQPQFHEKRLDVEVHASEVWRMLDLGTRRHPIAARNAPMLVFVWGGPGSYKAKTAPGVIGSWLGGPTGRLTAQREVDHPGTEARGWSKKVIEEERPALQKRIWDAIQDVADRLWGGGG